MDTTTTVAEPETTTTTIDLIDEDKLVYAVGDPTSVEAELETAYYRSWEAYQAAVTAADPDHPAIDLAQTGEVSSATRRAAQELSDAGEFTLSGSQSQQIIQGITLVDDATGIVAACNVDDGEFYSQDDPDTKIDGGIFTIQWSMKIVKEDGRWKAARLDRIDLVEGIGGCASFEPSS